MCGRKDESDVTQGRLLGKAGDFRGVQHSCGKKFHFGDAGDAELGAAAEVQTGSDWRFDVSKAGATEVNGKWEIVAEGEGAAVKIGGAATGAGRLEAVVD